MNGKQLKNSILQWAIQGKLVPQDPNDEPASVLLERIREEKARLVKEKKIKKDKNESIIYRGDDNSYYEKFADGTVKCIDDEIPFEIPEGWSWVRLKSVAEVARGGSPRPIKDYITESKDGINWIKIGDTEKDGKYINQTREKIIPAGLKKSRLIHKGDFLLTNSMSFGRPYISNIEGCIHDGWLVISPIGDSFIQDYLYYLLSSRFSYDQFCGVVSGAVVQNLNSDKVAGALFPLPPIEEQSRIVSILEEIIPHVKAYEHAQSELDKLNLSLLPNLKKSVLQEAIQGKLVPQETADEPASVLLDRIGREKQRLLSEGKLKKKDISDSVIFKGEDNKYYEQIGEDVVDLTDLVPFEIPDNWKWIRLRDICSICTGATFKKEEATQNQRGVRVLRGGNISPLRLCLKDDDIFISSDLVKDNILLKKNDIVTPAVTSLENIGKMARVELDMPTTTVGGFVFIIRPYLDDDILSEYLLSVMSAPTTIEFMRSITNKSGQAFYNIGKERLSTTLIPVPPHEEQKLLIKHIQHLFSKLR